ncbi:DUF1501 domain-containing protein [Agaribacterium haliotis]|uniref:DUF1501 domain-containing protein n=1 Tax=Agaribacterium haliotis TaxID=2013869 RepID=UPI000BB590C1|nr:DUF1501 domain-containing protein [Agaribacterium haliotis]
MKRRQFLRSAGLGVGLAMMPGLKLWAADESYTGKLLVTIRANGGWDPTLFCDPKENVPGERIITHWSENESTRRVGNIPYAAFGQNDDFFKRHYQKMLVVNGINTKTNSHKGGRKKMNAGDGSVASISGLFAHVHGSALTLPWLVDAYDRTYTEGLLVRTKVGGSGALETLVKPNQRSLSDQSQALHDDDHSLVQAYIKDRVTAFRREGVELDRAAKWLKHFEAASKQDPRLATMSETLSTSERGDFAENSFNNKLLFAVAAFKSGVSVSADLATGGFDTHNRNDERQAGHYKTLLSGIDYLWFLAEQHGFDDRLIVQVESDFARTPHYNNKDGKDHWSVGSKVFMEKNARWANKVAGGTDEGQNALRFNLSSLKRDDAGAQLSPNLVNHAFREYLGINEHADAQRMRLSEVLIPIFS